MSSRTCSCVLTQDWGRLACCCSGRKPTVHMSSFKLSVDGLLTGLTMLKYSAKPVLYLYMCSSQKY